MTMCIRRLSMLAIALARGLVRRELRTDPTQIIGIVRETVSLLPASARGVRVVLHPEDASLVRQRLPVNGPDQAWSISDDPVLARGDCRVFTEFAQIDARVESRLNEAIATLLGEERAQAARYGATMNVPLRRMIPWRDQLARSLRVASSLPEPPVEGQLCTHDRTDAGGSWLPGGRG